MRDAGAGLSVQNRGRMILMRLTRVGISDTILPKRQRCSAEERRHPHALFTVSQTVPRPADG